MIPAYNVEKYLPRCLESIVSQWTEGIRVFIIDDGSKDKTLNIIKTYSQKYKYIHFESQTNKGVSFSRNKLLEAATAKYIWFVDADDYILPKSIAKIKEELNDHPELDMLTILYNNSKSDKYFFGTGEQYIVEELYDGYLWTKIIRRDIITKYKVTFDITLRTEEDFLFLMQIYPRLSYVECSQILGYFYSLDNVNSLMRLNDLKHRYKNAEDSRKQIIMQKEIIDSLGCNIAISNALTNSLSYTTAGYFYSLLPVNYPISNIISDINFFRKGNVYPIKRTNNKKYNLFIFIANHKLLLTILFKLYRLLFPIKIR